MKKIGLYITMGAIIFGMTACNTVQGIGRDVKATGSVIERTAKKAQQ